MFNFGKPKTAGDWIVHIAGGHRRDFACLVDASDVRTVNALKKPSGGLSECSGYFANHSAILCAS
jgi:hypothetical protein